MVMREADLEATAIGQRVSSLAILNRAGNQFTAGGGNPVAIDKSPVGFPRELIELQRVVRLVHRLGLREFQIARAIMRRSSR